MIGPGAVEKCRIRLDLDQRRRRGLALSPRGRMPATSGGALDLEPSWSGRTGYFGGGFDFARARRRQGGGCRQRRANRQKQLRRLPYRRFVDDAAGGGRRPSIRRNRAKVPLQRRQARVVLARGTSEDELRYEAPRGQRRRRLREHAQAVGRAADATENRKEDLGVARSAPD